jgi:serine/threonine protein kinase
MKQLRRGYMRKVDREAYLNSMREIDIHKILKHKHIVELKTVIDDSQDDKVYLVMDYAGGGQIMTLDTKTSKFRPSRPGRDYLTEVEIREYSK